MGYREGYKPRFLFPRPGKTVFDQIMDMIDTDVRTIKIIAPYYDSEGSLINALKNRYNPDMIKCAIDESYGYVPEKMKYDNNIRFFHWHDVFCSENLFESVKKLHAKAIQFETSAGNMNKDTVGVWAMNLMETFKDDTAKLMSCYNDYLRLSNEYRSLMNKHSAEAIEKARARYLDYLESIAAGGNIETISKYQRNFYFHKEKFGFIFCKESYRATQEYYRLKVIYPGIKDETTFINNLPKIKKA